VSAAGTVVATSAEGAGDMPSSTPVTSGDSSPDGAQPFSELLSLSAPDLPGSSSSSPPPSSSVVPDEAHAQTDATATPTTEMPARGSAGSSGERGPRRAAPSGPGLRPAQSATGSLAPPPPAGEAVRIPPPGSTRSEDETAASDPDQTQGAPLPPTALAVLTPPATMVATTASDEPAVSGAGTAVRSGDEVPPKPAKIQEDGPALTTVTGSLTRPSDTLGAGSNEDGAQGSDAPAGRTPAATRVGGPEVRVLANRGVPSGSTVLQSGPVRILAPGSAPGAAASVLTAATAGIPESAAAPAEEVSELAQFPDGGGGTAGASVDVSDLADSISRPLAGGSGDYSVQVSLHPPELGEVRALLSLQGDVLHVTLTPEHSTGFEALSDAMPALHDQLAGGGVEVNVTLSHPGDPQGGDGRGAADSGPAGSAPSNGATSAATPAPSPMTSTDPGRIHLVL
jgi:hypothetical protein